MEQQKNNRTPLIISGMIIVILIMGGLWYYLASRQAASETTTSSNTTSTVSTSSGADEVAASEESANFKWSAGGQGPYNDKISYATSTDLLKWTDSGKTIREHASVPDIVLKDGTIYMYFVDVSTDGKPEQIGLMKSTDGGKTWSDREFAVITGKNVAKIVPVDPDPVLLSDGRIRLYYFDISGRTTPGAKTKNKIYSAVSTDGINFKQEDGVRFEEESIFDPDVLKVNDTWRLYVGNPDGQKVISATSTDGLNFTREGIAYEGSSVPNAIYEAGKYYLYTAGIQIATSTDGKTYTKTNSSFKSAKGATADPGVIKLGDKNFFMIYKTSDVQAQGAPPLGNPPVQ